MSAPTVGQRPLPWSAPFEALTPGDTFATGARAVTEADVLAFAELTGDRHPQHTDAGWAAGSPFGERIAHGLLVISLAAGLVPFDPARVVALRRIADAVFKRPVRFGDRVRVEGRIVAITPLDDRAARVTLAWAVVGDDGRAVCRATVEVLWSGGTSDTDNGGL